MHDKPDGGSSAPAKTPYLTNRRTFVAFGSLGAVSLYGLWAALGAAPLRFWEAPETAAGGMDMGHDGHGEHGGASGPSPEDFRKLVDAFVLSHKEADGSVLVDQAPDDAMQGMDMSGMDMSSGGHDHAMKHDAAAAGPEVYLLAEKWAFEPSWIKLRAGVPYRLKMMALDAAHGASLQLGKASQIVRLPKGALVERELNFTRPGTYLLYCTMYCGEGHQYMSGKIEVL